MAEQLIQRGTLEGHSGWVTSLATSLEKSVIESKIPIPMSSQLSLTELRFLALICCCLAPEIKA